MTPYSYIYDCANLFYMHSSGDFYGFGAGSSLGIRPVINLRADITFKSDSLGTSTNPYVAE